MNKKPNQPNKMLVDLTKKLSKDHSSLCKEILKEVKKEMADNPETRIDSYKVANLKARRAYCSELISFILDHHDWDAHRHTLASLYLSYVNDRNALDYVYG